MGRDLRWEQVSSMKEAFTLFDTDGDGKISASELGILMRSLGGNPTQAQLKDIVADEKLNAPFDFNRFLESRGAFKDGTGLVVVSDLRHILTTIGEKLEPAEFDDWFTELDVLSDGRIRYHDFITRMLAI